MWRFKFLFFLLSTLSFASLLQACGEKHRDVPGFIKLGTYKGETKCGEEYEKSYYVPKNIKAYWSIAAGICKSFGLEFLSLETQVEASDFLQLCSGNSDTFDQHTHIGGITTVPKSLNEWFWINSYNRIDYPLSFRQGQPDTNGEEFCLALQKEGNKFEFNDIKCYESWREKFICQNSSLSTECNHGSN